jgi:hypothetical protein
MATSLCMSFTDMKLWYYIWQFPQTLLALLLLVITKPHRKAYYRERIYYFWNKNGIISGVSLGELVFLPEESDTHTAKDHEYGHSIQSRYLGPFYLFVVGIPSMLFNNLWDRWFHTSWTTQQRINWYYKRFPERWADRLGGVNRP